MLLFTSTKRIIFAVWFAIGGLYALITGPFTGGGLTIIPISLFAFLIGASFIAPELIYYSKTAEQLWSKWDVVHDSKKQFDRMDRALNGDVTLKKICVKSKCAIFVGAQSGKYRTLLTSCDCPDFKKRHVPCKHMYYLAHELSLKC